MIKRFSAILIIAILIFVIMSPAAFAMPSKNYDHLRGTTLNVYNWGEYISDGSEGSLDVNKEFEKKYGIKVNYTNYESNENMYNKLKSGGADYDVVIPSDYMIAKLIEEDMLAKLNYDNIPNAQYILDDYKVKASLSEYYIDRITTGLPASISYQGRKFPMRISRVVPEVKERAFTVELVFTEEKPENARVGKSYRIQIELGKPEKALVIPRGDFYSYSGGRYVYKLNAAGTTAVRTPITIGRQNPKQFEVVEGLEPGDRIILSDYATFGEAERIKFR